MSTVAFGLITHVSTGARDFTTEGRRERKEERKLNDLLDPPSPLCVCVCACTLLQHFVLCRHHFSNLPAVTPVAGWLPSFFPRWAARLQ